MIFTYKTKPFSHQRAYIDNHAFKQGHAMWHEQGTGSQDQQRRCQEGAISGLLYLGPSGLHRNFITKEIPKHLADEIAERAKIMYWRSDKANTKAHQEEARALIAHKGGLKILAISYDSIMTDIGRAVAKEFLLSTSCLYGADESGRIANPEAARTIRVVGSGPFAKFRRGMTGTPVANAPWDVHSQIRFLDPDFWRPHGLNSFDTMKASFGVWSRAARRVPVAQAKKDKGLQAYYNKIGTPEELRTHYRLGSKDGSPTGIAFMDFPKLARDEETDRPQYKNLDKLRSIIAPIRDRVLKKDVLDLPPKISTVLEFDMSPAQQKCYDSIRQLGFAMIEETGETCSPNLALTVLLRLQQVACGYLVVDINPGNVDEPRVRPITPNPRIDLLLEITKDLSHPALIWARFQADIEQIVAGLKKQGQKVATYYGGISDEECGENEDAFHRGDVQFLALTQSKGGEGLTLVEAQTAIFWSNSFSMRERVQASDRPHRHGQTKSVNEIDFIARDTVDERILSCLQGKKDVAAQVTGDPW